MKNRWTKASLWWLEEDTLFKNLKGNNAGTNISILKTYLAITLESDYESRRTSRVSYSDLEEVTGLSRPMIARAINILVEKRIMEKEGSGRGATNSYKLIDEGDGWTKLPFHSLKNNLSNFSNRSPASLYALKNFLVILKFRNNKTTYTQITHETLVNKTGTPTNQIKRANDLLINNGLINLVRINTENKISTEANIYGTQGLTENRIFNEKE